MKTIVSFLLLITFCITPPLMCNEPPQKIDDAALKHATEQKHKKIAAVVLGTLATITIGLIASGANTGKKPPVANP